MEKAGGEKGEWESRLRRHRACRTTAGMPLSWVCHPAAGTSYFRVYSNFTVTVLTPSLCQALFELFWFFSLFLSCCPCFLGYTQASISEDRSSLFSSSFLFAQGQIFISPKSHPHDSQMTGSGGCAAGYGHVFMGLYALLPVPSAARNQASFVHWPQDLARDSTQSRQVVNVRRVG